MGIFKQFLPALPSLVTSAARFCQLGKRAEALKCKLASGQGWYLAKSDISGEGVFAARDYQPNDIIGVAMVASDKDELGMDCWNLTLLARYCNHQSDCNTVIKKNENRIDLVASKEINTDDELTVDYRQVAREIGPYARMLWEGKPVPSTDLKDYKERADL